MISTHSLRKVVDRRAKSLLRGLLEEAGIQVGGDAPHDIEVHDERFYTRVLLEGSLGLGEAYMDGWWDAPAVDEAVATLLRARLDRRLRSPLSSALLFARARIANLQSVERATEVGRRHYDIGNDLYQAMLGEWMVYTCAYFAGEDDLDRAQEAKLDLVCRKVGLERGMRVLELGCGWGSFARFAAERYGVEVTCYNISEKQVERAREVCVGLPVDVRHEDYRNADGSYDAVVSIGIMEHVGPRNYDAYMEVVDRCLAPGGTGFVHTIAGNWSTEHINPWIHRYIFPNAVIPSLANLARALEHRFVVEDLHNIGPHYDRTLMAWFHRFDEAWPRFRAAYGDRFYRMWKYYLLSCAATFRVRRNQLFQLVFTREGTPQPACRQL